MSIFFRAKTYSYNCDNVAFSVGRETKDSYSVVSHYHHDHDTDVVEHKHEVVKNWSHSEVPQSGRVEGKKYRETIFSGSVKDCHEHVKGIVKEQGYWGRDPKDAFKEIFVEITD